MLDKDEVLGGNGIKRSPAPRVPRDYRQMYRPGHEMPDWDGIAIVAITILGCCLLYLLGAYWDAASGVLP